MNWKGAKWNGLRVSRSYQVISITYAEWFVKAALALLVHLSSWSSSDRLMSDTLLASAFDCVLQLHLSIGGSFTP